MEETAKKIRRKYAMVVATPCSMTMVWRNLEHHTLCHSQGQDRGMQDLEEKVGHSHGIFMHGCGQSVHKWSTNNG